MGKKDSKDAKEAAKARKAEKAAKAKAKGDNKNKKLANKVGDEEDVDLDEMLAEFARQQSEFEKVFVEATDQPTKRQNASLVVSPLQGRKELLLFGGEAVVEGYSKFYNDLYIYGVNNDQWRKVTSANSPLPRSGHYMCAHPSGVVLLFGGEFSSPKQTTFYHYGDTWIFDPSGNDWTKVESKKSPAARSGHRMVVWKNYILLHGGFKDLSASTSYYQDLWAFDVKDYKWHEIEFPRTASVPDARSGHSLLPHADGALAWGGYSKVKASKGQQKGKVHQDTWMLKMKGDLKGVTWERRKKPSSAPTPRIGCSMVFHQGRGILFGGVYDTQETEESLESIYYNDLYAYSVDVNRWHKQALKASRRRNGSSLARNQVAVKEQREGDLQENLSKILQSLNIDVDEMLDETAEDDELDEKQDLELQREYPVVSQLPHPRFGAALAVVGNQLFVYGGIWESGESEFTLDSFYSIDLSRLDGVKVLWENYNLEVPSDNEEDEDDDGADEDGDDGEDEILISEDEDDGNEEETDEDNTNEEDPDPRPWLPHPKPFETMTAFYRSHINHFVEWALKMAPDSRGKDLKRTAFELAESRWWERRDAVQVAEDQMEEIGGVDEVIERKDARTFRR